VSHSSFSCDLFCSLSRGLVYISNVNPACSCDYFWEFQFRPIHPPLGDFQRHTPTLKYTRFCIPLGTSFESKLCIPLGMTFELLHLLFRWYKFCIPLGTTFELLRLLFQRYKFCIPLGTTFELLRLIFRWYLALHSLWNDFWAENLHCAPFGTTFGSFVNFGSAFP
jgi:hypothetical protein